MLRFGFDPETNVFGFCLCSGIIVIWRRMKPKMVHSREGTKRCSIFMGPRLGPFCVLLLD